MTYPLLATFVRYSLLALAGHLATRGYFDETLVDAIVSAGVALSAIVWYLVTSQRPEPSSGADQPGGR